MSIAVHELGHMAVGLTRSPTVTVKRIRDGYEVIPSAPTSAEEALDGMASGVISEHLHRLGSIDKVKSYLKIVGVQEFCDTQIGFHDAQLLQLLPEFKLNEIIERVGPIIAMELNHPTLAFEMGDWLQSMRVGECRLIRFDGREH